MDLHQVQRLISQKIKKKLLFLQNYSYSQKKKISVTDFNSLIFNA